MVDLNNIKTILQVAGINQLKIQFDDDQQLVNVEYVFRGKPGTRQLTYDEIIKLLTIGHPGPAVSAGPAQVHELSELPGET